MIDGYVNKKIKSRVLEFILKLIWHMWNMIRRKLVNEIFSWIINWSELLEILKKFFCLFSCQHESKVKSLLH